MKRSLSQLLQENKDTLTIPQDLLNGAKYQVSAGCRLPAAVLFVLKIEIVLCATLVCFS